MSVKKSQLKPAEEVIFYSIDYLMYVYISELRLRDFYIGVTNTSVSDTVPSVVGPNYDVCYDYVGKSYAYHYAL